MNPRATKTPGVDAPERAPRASARAVRPARPARAAKAFALAPTTSLPAMLDEDGRSDRGFRQLLYDISIAAAHLETARQYLADRMGVTPPQYNIVMVVAQYEGDSGISVSDVAARLNVSGAFVTTEVKKLVRQDLLQKETNPDDGRGVLLRLTPHGEATVLGMATHQVLVNDRLFGSLTRQDFRQLSRIVGSLIEGFGQTVAVLRAMSAANGGTVARKGRARG